MSLNRYAAKVDSTQKAIVDGLRKIGFRVEIIGEPVDLLVGKPIFWQLMSKDSSINQIRYSWSLLEVKRKSGLRRKDQPTQNLFVDETHTPVVSNLEEALAALK